MEYIHNADFLSIKCNIKMLDLQAFAKKWVPIYMSLKLIEFSQQFTEAKNQKWGDQISKVQKGLHCKVVKMVETSISVNRLPNIIRKSHIKSLGTRSTALRMCYYNLRYILTKKDVSEMPIQRHIIHQATTTLHKGCTN